MDQRNVSQDEVFDVLNYPKRKGLPTEPGRFRWRAGRVQVIFEKRPDRLIIITVIK
jgi:hypothetical protein